MIWGMENKLARLFATHQFPGTLVLATVAGEEQGLYYLRGSDHLSFQSQGYPAARFTEPRENFNHEHQDVRVDGGVQFGDLPQFVDFDYTARVAKVNGAALWALATNPSTPKNLQIHTAPPPGRLPPGSVLTATPYPKPTWPSIDAAAAAVPAAVAPSR